MKSGCNEILKWRQLQENKIFQVLAVMEDKGMEFNPFSARFRSRSGEILEVWIRPQIYNKLKIYDLSERKIYIKSLGLKPYKSNPEKNYFDINIMTRRKYYLY